MVIFTITSIDSESHLKTQRTFGWFPNLLLAQQAVTTNKGNINEHLYDYVVIEKMSSGIHPEILSEIWYNWDNEKWVVCEKPEFSRGIVNWALG